LETDLQSLMKNVNSSEGKVSKISHGQRPKVKGQRPAYRTSAFTQVCSGFSLDSDLLIT